MARRTRFREALPLYLIPIMIGVCGILFSFQFPNPMVRSLVVLVSVATPLFTMGNVMARLRVAKEQRLVLVLGAIMLSLGGLVTAWNLLTSFQVSTVFMEWEEAPEGVRRVSQWIGMLGLMLGLGVVLYSVVRQEERVGEVVRHFGLLAEQMNEGLLLTGPDGTITLVNNSFLAMAALSEEEVLGERAADVMALLATKADARDQMRWEGTGASQHALSWVRDGEEHHFWMNRAPVFDDRGELAGSLATFQDITELQEMAKRIEESAQDLQVQVEERTRQLLLSERRLRGLLLNMNEGFVTVDSASNIQFANDRICSLLLREPSEIIGANLFTLVEAVSRERLLGLLRDASSGDSEPSRRELMLLRADGSEVPVMVAAAPVDSPAEEETRFSLVVTDVDDLKRMQRELEQRADELEAVNEELRSLDRAKDSFLTNVSHELRTPLSTVRGYVEMFESGTLGLLDPAKANAIGVMSRNVHRLGSLIEEMIEFSRMQIRGVDLDWSLFSFRALVDESATSIQPRLMEKRIRLEVACVEELPPVWGDRKRLSQVLEILLSNAAKFSYENGTIEILVTREPEHGLTVDVRDYGIGIAPAYHQRVFDKFFQVDSSLARRYEGAGIGLSIAKRFVEAHGGSITVSGDVGKGSRFRMVFPAATFDGPVPESLSQHLKGLRVVLADAQPESRDALLDVLSACGCVVATAANCYECGRLAREAHADLVMLTEEAPDLSGATTVAHIRDKEASPGLPVLISVNLGLEEVASGQHLPKDPRVVFLMRPFSREELARRVVDLRYPVREEETFSARAKRMSQGSSEQQVVLVLDQDEAFLEWMEMSLHHRRILCRCARRLPEALEVARMDRVVVLLLDIDSTDGDAASYVEAIGQACGNSDLPVYGMSGFPGADRGISPLKGVFRKPFSMGDVLHVIGGELSGQSARAMYEDVSDESPARRL